MNNAGYQQAQASFADVSTEQFDATFKTNVYALFWNSKAALPHLPAGATIVNTASINAYNPSEDLFDYAATKAAVGKRPANPSCLAHARRMFFDLWANHKRTVAEEALKYLYSCMRSSARCMLLTRTSDDASDS